MFAKLNRHDNKTGKKQKGGAQRGKKKGSRAHGSSTVGKNENPEKKRGKMVPH